MSPYRQQAPKPPEPTLDRHQLLWALYWERFQDLLDRAGKRPDQVDVPKARLKFNQLLDRGWAPEWAIIECCDEVV